MFVVSDMYGRIHDKCPTKEEALEFFKNIEGLANTLRCEWEYVRDDTMALKNGHEVINIYTVYEQTNP